MAFLVQDYHDLVQLLAEHPEWRAELRRLLLSDELLTLPETVRELAEAQRRTEVRVEQLAEAQRRTEARVEELAEAQRRTEVRVEQLAEAQRRTEARVDELAADVRQLTGNVQELTASVRELAEAQRRTEVRVEELAATVRELAEAQRRMTERLGHVIGDLLELRYREHAAGYFGRWLRHARAVDPETLEDTLEAALPHEDVLDVLRLDLLISGRWRALPEAPDVWLAVEVASVLDEADVARAWRRASLLRRAGYQAVPLVAGEQITADAQASARAQTVGVVQDGQGVFNADELATWLA